MGIKAIVFTSNAAQVYKGILAERAIKVEIKSDQKNNH
jgi:hypothetical protein